MVSKRFLESTELQILKDVHRTFPNHIFFSGDAVRRVATAHLSRDRVVGWGA